MLFIYHAMLIMGRKRPPSIPSRLRKVDMLFSAPKKPAGYAETFSRTGLVDLLGALCALRLDSAVVASARA